MSSFLKWETSIKLCQDVFHPQELCYKYIKTEILKKHDGKMKWCEWQQRDLVTTALDSCFRVKTYTVYVYTEYSNQTMCG